MINCRQDTLFNVLGETYEWRSNVVLFVIHLGRRFRGKNDFCWNIWPKMSTLKYGSVNDLYKIYRAPPKYKITAWVIRHKVKRYKILIRAWQRSKGRRPWQEIQQIVLSLDCIKLCIIVLYYSVVSSLLALDFSFNT